MLIYAPMVITADDELRAFTFLFGILRNINKSFLQKALYMNILFEICG